MSDNTSQQHQGPAPEEHTPEKKPKLGLGHMVLTVLAAAIGVQTSKNHAKDFEQGSPLPYIIAGVVFTAVFLVTLILVVKWVLAE